MVFITLLLLAAGNGGYFPVAWGWAAAGLGTAGVIATLLGNRIEVTRLEACYLVAWAALAGWSAISLVWSADSTLTVLALERLAAYVTLAATLVALRSRGRGTQLMVAVLAAIVVVCGYSLTTHLFPERFGSFSDVIQPGRLYQPVGYWNALGLLAVMGYLVALGVVAGSRRPVLRIVAAGTMPMLACTAYFTFSRGAWLVVAAGLAGALAIGQHKLRYLTAAFVTAPCPVFTVIVARRQSALVASMLEPATGERQGAFLAVVVAATTAAAITTGWVFPRLADRIQARRGAGSRMRLGRKALTVGICLLALVGAGGSAAIWHELGHGTRRTPAGGRSLNGRLTSLSFSGRPAIWLVALDDYRQHPLLGSGAGTFQQFWYAHRRSPLDIRDAHNLYLQTLAELGPVGLLVLTTLLALPLIAAVKARGDPLMPAAAAPYLAYVIHASVDWDWIMPAVTVPAIVCAHVLFNCLRTPTTAPSVAIRGKIQLMFAVATFALALAALGGLVGNIAISHAETALGADRPAAAVRDAQTAQNWQPWSPRPYVIAGDAALEVGNLALAAHDYRDALAVDGRCEDAWVGLASVTKGGDRARALAEIHRLDPLAKTPSNAPG